MSTTLSSYKELIPADRHGANGGVVCKPQFFKATTQEAFRRCHHDIGGRLSAYCRLHRQRPANPKLLIKT